MGQTLDCRAVGRVGPHDPASQYLSRRRPGQDGRARVYGRLAVGRAGRLVLSVLVPRSVPSPFCGHGCDVYSRRVDSSQSPLEVELVRFGKVDKQKSKGNQRLFIK